MNFVRAASVAPLSLAVARSRSLYFNDPSCTNSGGSAEKHSGMWIAHPLPAGATW